MHSNSEDGPTSQTVEATQTGGGTGGAQATHVRQSSGAAGVGGAIKQTVHANQHSTTQGASQ